MQLDVSINAFYLRRLQRDLERTHGAIGITTQWLTWDTARLAANDAIKYSAPWAAGKPGTGSAQLASGKSAIAYDLLGSKGGATRRAKRLGVFDFLPDNIKRTFIQDGVVVNVTSSGRIYAKDETLYRPNASLAEMKAHHLRYRGKNGRTTTAGAKTRNIGRWKSTAKMMVPREKMDQYLRYVQSKVGELKASWLPAARYFAQKVGGKVGASAWIVKQGKQLGTYIDSVNATGNGYASLTNLAPHNEAIRPDMVKFIESQRNKFIMRVTPKRMQQIADQFNRNRTPQPIRETAAA